MKARCKRTIDKYGDQLIDLTLGKLYEIVDEDDDGEPPGEGYIFIIDDAGDIAERQECLFNFVPDIINYPKEAL